MIARDALSETHRNSLLRRVDWRFLLRNPQPAASLCFGDDPLAQAVAAISNQVKNAQSEARASCDLAVATNPDAKTLNAAWAVLEPGGVLYTEWTMPIRGRVGRVQKMLQSSGFQDVQCYWPWPLPDRSPLFWVPLGTLSARSAWRYLLASRPPDRHRLRQWVRWLGRTTAYSLHELGLLTPVCAIAYKPDEDNRSSAASPSLAGWLRAHWLDWRLGPLPDEISLLLLTGGQRSVNKIVALAFADADTSPRLVVKMPRVADSMPGLRREAEMLKAVHARRASPMPGVPQVVFCEEHDSLLMLGETVHSGVPLFTRLDRRNYRTWAFKATDWLIELAGTPLFVSRDDWWSHVIEPILNDFQSSFTAILDQYLIQETYRMLEQIRSLPLICEQRDFSPWNVLITAQGELGVLDWESAELDGLPGLDLIYFLTYLAFFVEGVMDSGALIETYRGCWSEQTSIGRVNTECWRYYCAALKLDDALEPALRLFTWLLHARAEYARLTADAGGQPSSEVLRRSMFVQLWEEEVRCGYARERI